jgi:hypothetical protein
VASLATASAVSAASVSSSLRARGTILLRVL